MRLKSSMYAVCSRGCKWKSSIRATESICLVSYCLVCLFGSFYLIKEMETWSRDLDLYVLQRWKRLHIDWHNFELFAGARAKIWIEYTETLAFGHDSDSFKRFLVAPSLCLFTFLVFLAANSTSLTSHARLAILEFVF